MNDYSEVLDIQVATARRFANDTRFSDATGGGFALSTPGKRLDRGSASVFAEATKAAMLRMLSQGSAFYCVPEVAKVVMVAAETMPGNWSLQASDLPTPEGFMLVRFPGDPPRAWGWCGMGDRCATFTFFRIEGEVAIPGRSLLWVYGNSLDELTATVQEDIYTVSLLGYIASMLSFLRERITTTTTRVANRSIQRKIARLKASHSPAIHVIELRAREHHYTEGESETEHRDWSCQWLVRGHWRQQWYPSLGTHQPKWIAPYVKGPEDKPLKSPAAQVFAVVR